MKAKQKNDRRDFLKKCSLATVPLLIPSIGLNASTMPIHSSESTKSDQPMVNFIFDGLNLSPKDYLAKLNEIDQKDTIDPDVYGNGGDTKKLEEVFAKLTGKESAIYLPSGTMANQLALKLLNGQNTKAIVPENSHIFRDEADAAQAVHRLRLVAVGKDKSYFDLEDLKNTIDYLDQSEVFKSGLGTVVLENPVRRADGAIIPIETIKQISNYCRERQLKLHLDGARLHIASAYSGVSIAEYSSYFDTVYISLYKYLNTSGGAILCGEAKLLTEVAHQMKIFGGTIYQSWTNTSIALHYLNGIEDRWKSLMVSAEQLMNGLNKINEVEITKIKDGSNIFNLKLAKEIDTTIFVRYLHKEHHLWLGRPDENGIIKFHINESLNLRNIDQIIKAWKMGIEASK